MPREIMRLDDCQEGSIDRPWFVSVLGYPYRPTGAAVDASRLAPERSHSGSPGCPARGCVSAVRCRGFQLRRQGLWVLSLRRSRRRTFYITDTAIKALRYALDGIFLAVRR